MGILYPAFALFLLTMFVQFRLGMLRFAAVKNSEIDARYYKTYAGFEEPEHIRVYTRHLTNLYEAPVLFYTIVLIAAVSGQSGILPTTLAWAYVACRYLHSFVHLGSNRIVRRFRVFVLSLGLLIALWAVVLTGMLLQ